MLKLAKTSLLTIGMMTSSMLASDILVTVNGKNITKQDAQTFVTASAPQAIYGQLTESQKTLVKDRLIEKILFTELAQKEKIDEKLEFKKTIEKIKDDLIVSLWMKEQMENAIVSDSEAQKFYEANRDKFLEKASINARHILVDTKKEAEDIIATLKPLKNKVLLDKFVKLAKSKSTGPSATRGGDLGSFSKGQMVPSFSKAVWALENGQITLTPVKTKFGYHIIYLNEKILETTVSYDKVKEKIVSSLKQQQFSVKVGEIAKELKSKATIVDLSIDKNVTK